MTLGFGLLRLSPRDFWSMTLRELSAATGHGLRAADAPGRGDLSALMAAFPDA